MSLTEVQSVHSTRLESLHHTNLSSISVRAALAPPSDQDGGGLRKVHINKGDIEMAQLPGPPIGSSGSTRNTAEGITPLDTVSTHQKQKPSSAKSAAFIQFAVLCWTLFLAGWNDGTTGPLLPRIQENYHVGYAIVSLLFVFGCLGCIGGALANVHLTEKLGLGKTLVLGCLSQLVGYALMAPAPPFPVFVLGYVFNSFGLSLQDAGANGYVASLKDNAETKMGVIHAAYGIGALIAPLPATQFSNMPRWSFQYLISVGIAISNLIALIAVFRGRRQDECLADIGQTPTESASSDENKYRQIFRLREVHVLALFALIYVGVEVTIAGWSVTYILNVRGGGKNSGYVSSGFFGGLTFGRVALLPLNKKIGERNAVFIYTVLAIALEFIIWFVPSLTGGAVAVSFIGVFLGPIYPLLMNHSGRILPHWLLTGSIGWIGGVGAAGSAFVPFITGALASKEGIAALQPLMIAMMAAMFLLWALVPSLPRRVD
ncbi:MFS general substrate transporter [Irpex rosettiformis]|uniref:MFS general substrate transporter n=1 Tax=Irpex rosettiformis TaxID=378272 RepID=A0ACB8TZ88_9APHY|nr:MFS general substrate transporter [Irpex rosettiformis]